MTTIEEEIKKEIQRLKSEIAEIEEELEDIETRKEQLINLKDKKIRDLSVLEFTNGDNKKKKDPQTSLLSLG